MPCGAAAAKKIQKKTQREIQNSKIKNNHQLIIIFASSSSPRFPSPALPPHDKLSFTRIMGRLEYDSSAFLFFALSSILTFLVPATLGWLMPSVSLIVGTAARPKPLLPECNNWNPAQARISSHRDQIQKANHLSKVQISKLKIALLVIGWIVAGVLFYMQGGEGKDIQQFDPLKF